VHPISHVVPAALMELLRSTPLSQGKVAFAWKASVGPALERATSVRLEGTTLVVETQGPQWTREIGRSTPIILARLKTLLGDQTVQSVEVRTRAERRP
jgi:Dna[CI] antecedent DciA-like protein